MSESKLTQQELDGFQQAVVGHCLQFLTAELAADDNVLAKNQRLMIANAIWNHLQKHSVSSVITTAVFHDIVLLAFQHADIQSLLETFMSKAVSESFDALASTSAPITAGLSQQAFMDSFQWYFGDKDRQVRWVHAVVQNAQYRQMISSVVVQVLRQFFREEAILSKLPGVGQFLKMSKWGVGKVLPQWEQTLEALVHSFVARNLQALLGLSEGFLIESFSEQNIQHLGEQVWDYLSIRPLRDLVNKQSLSEAELMTWGQQHWQVLKAGALWQELMVPLIRVWADSLSKVTFGEAADILKIPQDRILDCTQKWLLSFILGIGDSTQVQAFLSQMLAPCFSTQFLNSALRASLEESLR